MQSWVSKNFKHKVAVVAGVRTPFAKAGSALKNTSAVHLGVTAVREAIAQAGITVSEIDEVVLGNAGTPADAANISRVIALRSGIPESVSAYTVHRNCASAMEAVAQGCVKISSGLCDVMVVGGTESMSEMPLIVGDELKEFITLLSTSKSVPQKLQALTHFRPHWLKPVIAIMEGLTDPISGLNMGQTAEVLARDFGISRQAQDEYALMSHQRASKATQEGKLAQEIVPVLIEPDYKKALEKDIGPRAEQSLEALAKLRPFFDRENGTVTAGNACPITDGAVALVLMDAEKAKADGREILGYISGYAFTGCDPKRMGMGPVYSTSKLLKDSQTELAEIQRIELNEAFSGQVIANQIAFSSEKYAQEKLGRTSALGELSLDKLNVNGGAVALGHPVGATGARLVLTLLKELERENLNKGLATLCIGGGQGGAMLVERD